MQSYNKMVVWLHCLDCNKFQSAHKQFVTQLLAVDMDESSVIDSVQLLLQYLPVVVILVLQASHKFNLIKQGM